MSRNIALTAIIASLSLSGCYTHKLLSADSARKEIKVPYMECARDFADIVLKNGIKVVTFRIDEKTDAYIAGWPTYTRSYDDYQKIYFKDIKSITLIQNDSPMACLRL